MIYHMIAFGAGFVLDLLLGDPYTWPHPVKWMGSLIAALEKHYLGEKGNGGETERQSDVENAGAGKTEKYTAGEKKNGKKPQLTGAEKRRAGRLTVAAVLGATLLVTAALLVGGYLIHPILGCVIETIMTYQALAVKSLKTESMKVYDRLKNGTLAEARYAVSMIVGRDTAALDERQVTKAAVETVAENTSDGVIAPMLYLAVGGPILGLLYKAVNTMDSMIGYKNDRFLDYGRCAAKLDDIVNYLPARISAWLLIVSCLFLGREYSAEGAKKIYLRDRYNHASPNSAQTESACAGALGLRLAGPASYFGKVVEKPFIGDAKREIEYEDIRRANRLLYMTAFLSEIVCLGCMAALI